MTDHLCLSGSPACSGLFPCEACRAVYGQLVVPKALMATAGVTVAGITALLAHYGIMEAPETIQGLANNAQHVSAFLQTYNQAMAEVQERLRQNADQIAAHHAAQAKSPVQAPIHAPFVPPQSPPALAEEPGDDEVLVAPKRELTLAEKKALAAQKRAEKKAQEQNGTTAVNGARSPAANKLRRVGTATPSVPVTPVATTEQTAEVRHGKREEG